ncbi:hypothetical protein PUR34_18555 [Streptomyces sp. JV185]|uniref:hypothetical protein n=1 Tax=Streptomyces sp. JV185 TaxID=858638 RepID=UPI002E792791|nr:hypothetical protein [Streptomyces sp. JV185]MEE1770094.1 hypothetical protein [Streptomyces sp. JV185]
MQCVIEPVVTERLGAVPVAAEFLRRLDVVGIVDALCPPDPRAELTHDQVIEVLVANRELARQAAGVFACVRADTRMTTGDCACNCGAAGSGVGRRYAIVAAVHAPSSITAGR